MTSCPQLLNLNLLPWQNVLDETDCIQSWYTTSIKFIFTFVVNVEPVILTPTRNIVAVSRQANKILLVHMSCEETNLFSENCSI